MKSTHKFLLLAVFVFGLFFGPTVIAEDQGTLPCPKAKKTESNPMSVVIDGFVLEIDNSLLYDEPADLIMAKSDIISIEKVMRLMKANKGVKMVSFIRGYSISKNNFVFEVEAYKNIRIEDEQGGRRSSASYRICNSFKASVYVDEGKGFMSMEYNLKQDAVESKKKDKLEGVVTYNWSGCVGVSPGQPAIVGCNQDGDKTLLLIIKAEINETLP